MTRLSDSERAAYIDALELATPPQRIVELHRARRTGAALLTATSEPTAAVVDGSAVSFVTGISQQHRDDVLDSTLLAQLAASAAYDRYTQTDDWYKKYVEVLETGCSWVAQEFKFSRYNLTGNTFTVQEVVLKLIEAIASKSEKKIVEGTLAALKALSDKDGRLVLFDRASHKNGNGNFQIGICAEAGDTITFKIGAFHFKSRQDTTRFLWFSYSTSDTQIFSAGETITLNEREYAKHREAIQRKLGKRIEEYIADLPLKP